mmetsp:Transcript_23177/g.22653  ORF Transcript_23177/g.22653 Transcript_23177/m.22653 type:complete len:128 (+) Transcript_23177:209-592(+)
MVGWWYFNYWSIYLLNWFLLPFLMEYLEAAEATFKEKCIRALKNQVPWYAIYLILFALVVCILLFTDSGREALQEEGMLGCMMGLSLVAGLLCVVILLGYGISAIPVNLLKYYTLEKQLSFYQFKVA